MGDREMQEVEGWVRSVHAGSNTDYSKPSGSGFDIELEGFPGDRHRGFTRLAQSWDPEPTGIPRRNERQWSGVSVEELELIGRRMDLSEVLSAETLGANLCLEGIPDFSQLPKGSKLFFPSGAVLLVEEENPPCGWMGDQVAATYSTHSGAPVAGKMFPRLALGLRGVVGVVDVAGAVHEGDRVRVRIFAGGPL
ncbi:MAG: MOSC domain-containing protein [Myxococcota bacterium]|nr:MOSC domain-containing protein [Myxococcota bacterium]